MFTTTENFESHQNKAKSFTMRDDQNNSSNKIAFRVPSLMIGSNSSMQVDQKVENDKDSPELPDDVASDSHRSLNYHLLKKAEDIIERVEKIQKSTEEPDVQIKQTPQIRLSKRTVSLTG